MNSESIDIATFTQDHGFYGKLELLVTIKSFELGEIRKRYLESKKNTSGKVGSVERRSAAIGGIAQMTIKDGRCSANVLAKVEEPRGVAATKDQIAVSSENKVYLMKDGKIQVINNPWFSYIHTLDFSADGDRLLISSSGFDAIFEYGTSTLEAEYEWFAWENGFNQGIDPNSGEPVTLSRKPAENIENLLVIKNPTEQVLPTAMRAAFINSVEYDIKDETKLLATFFHEGAVYSIDKEDGTATKVLTDLKNPHGGKRIGQAFLATSTGTGEIVQGEGNQVQRYTVRHLPGKPQELADAEWIQNTEAIGGVFIAIDSNRNSFVVFEPLKRLFDQIPFDANWAIQDLVECELTEVQKNSLSAIGYEKGTDQA